MTQECNVKPSGPECFVCHFGPADGVALIHCELGLICVECRNREEEAIEDMEDVYYNPLENYDDYEVGEFRFRSGEE